MNKDCPNFQVLNTDFNSHKKKKIKVWCKSNQNEKYDWKYLISLAGEEYGKVEIKFNEKLNINQIEFFKKRNRSSLSEKIEKMREERKGQMPMGKQVRPPMRKDVHPKERLWMMYNEMKKLLGQQEHLRSQLDTILPNPDRVKKEKEVFQMMASQLPADNPMKMYVEACLSF